MSENSNPKNSTKNPADLPPNELSTLRAIMRALRAPVSGCPWDVAQTFETIAPYTIEEAYEVADAIGAGDMSGLCEELGDLLLQVVYHSQMAEEARHFTFDDVVGSINAKMVRRHPHVFGDEKARSTGLAKGFWEAMKASEKPSGSKDGVLEGVASALPALTRARKLQAKAAGVGFDWPVIDDVFEKIAEECDELRVAARAGDKTDVAEELGDLLFAIANLARHLDVDPEQALRSANEKFVRRFAFIERELARHGRKPAQSDLDEMDRLWDAAKKNERQEASK